MSLRLVRRAVAPVAGLATALGGTALVGIAPAGAASAPGWQISEVLTAPSTFFQALATSGPTNAVAAGTAVDSMVLQQWSGSAWQALAPPSQFVNLPAGQSVNVDAAGTSATGNTWVFAEAGGNTLTQYAMGWNGSAWTVFNLSTKNSVQATAVFSPTDVWSFGAKPGTGASGGFGPAWVLHYDGTAWQTVKTPGTPVDVSSPSSTDIWALGPSAASVNKPAQVYIAMHWNGTAWRSLALPKLSPVAGQPWVPAGIVATSPKQVWVQENVAVNRGSGTQPPGITLLHWDGTTWTTVVQNTTSSYAPGLTSDGHGGLWLTSNDPSQPTTSIIHYTGGQFHSQKAPTEPGFTNGVGGFTLIPGTTSVWGTGSLTSADGVTSEADIVKHGP